MSGPQRDWDKELAAIDRAMARLPEPAGPPAQTGGATPASRAGSSPARTPTPKTAAWLRVLLVVLLAAAMPFWPYGRGCGFGLFAYLAAAGVVVLGGVWAAISTWHGRRPVAHVAAILVTIWGLGLVAVEVLPRVGYARQVVRWTCG